MELKETQINTIVYQKDGGVPEERKVVPSFIPFRNIRAIDVANLPVEEAEEMVEMLREYQQYYADFISRAYNFETWVEHTKNKTINPKWRSFKLDNILEVK
jgi:hypothetical protein